MPGIFRDVHSRYSYPVSPKQRQMTRAKKSSPPSHGPPSQTKPGNRQTDKSVEKIKRNREGGKHMIYRLNESQWPPRKRGTKHMELMLRRLAAPAPLC